MQFLSRSQSKSAKALCSKMADVLYEEAFLACVRCGFKAHRENLHIDFFPPYWLVMYLPLDHSSIAVAADPFGSFFQDEKPGFFVTMRLNQDEAEEAIFKTPSFGAALIIGRKLSSEKWEWKSFSLPVKNPARTLSYLKKNQKQEIKFFCRLVEQVPWSKSAKTQEEKFFRSLIRAETLWQQKT